MIRPVTKTGNTVSRAQVLPVITLLTIVAWAAVPAISAQSGGALSQAVSELADAFRFARDAAQRSGVIHGVELEPQSGAVRVFRLERTPRADLPVFDVHDPRTGKPYAMVIGVSPFADVRIADVGGDLSEDCVKNHSIAFDSRGVVRCIDPVTTRIHNAFVELAESGVTATVKVDAYTGRVLVQ